MDPVPVSILFWGPFTLPIALVLFVTALAGFLLGVAAAYGVVLMLVSAAAMAAGTRR